MDFVGIPCYIFYKKLYLRFTNFVKKIEYI